MHVLWPRQLLKTALLRKLMQNARALDMSRSLVLGGPKIFCSAKNSPRLLIKQILLAFNQILNKNFKFCNYLTKLCSQRAKLVFGVLSNSQLSNDGF